jgi:hypothetical protein
MVPVLDWDGIIGAGTIGAGTIGAGTIGVGTTIGMVIIMPTLMEDEIQEFIITTALEELQTIV